MVIVKAKAKRLTLNMLGLRTFHMTLTPFKNMVPRWFSDPFPQLRQARARKHRNGRLQWGTPEFIERDSFYSMLDTF